MTSARPGCMNGSARRSATVIPTSRSIAARTSATSWTAPWISSGEVAGEVEQRPPRAWCRCRRSRRPYAASASGTPQPSSAASTSRSYGGDLVGGRRVVGRRCRSCSRTEPTSIDRAARTPAGSPRTSSVEPPPMSTTSTGAVGRVGEPAHRPREGQRRLLVAGDHLRRRRPAAPGPGGEDVPVGRVPGRPRWRRTGPAPAARRGRATSAAYSSTAANTRASASSASRPVAVDALPEPDHPRLADQHVELAGRRGEPTSSLTVLVPQSTAATRSATGPVRRRRRGRRPTTRRAARAPRRRAG